MKQIIGILFFAQFGSFMAFSQELRLISSSGTYSTSATHSVEWSIGEVVVATSTSGSHHLTQGFHQSNVFVTGIKELSELEISVYPNPTSSYITIDSPNALRLTVYDMGGKLVGRYDLVDESNQIDVSHLSRGTYNLVFESKTL